MRASINGQVERPELGEWPRSHAGLRVDFLVHRAIGDAWQETQEAARSVSERAVAEHFAAAVRR